MRFTRTEVKKSGKPNSSSKEVNLATAIYYLFTAYKSGSTFERARSGRLTMTGPKSQVTGSYMTFTVTGKVSELAELNHLLEMLEWADIAGREILICHGMFTPDGKSICELEEGTVNRLLQRMTSSPQQAAAVIYGYGWTKPDYRIFQQFGDPERLMDLIIIVRHAIEKDLKFFDAAQELGYYR